MTKRIAIVGVLLMAFVLVIAMLFATSQSQNQRSRQKNGEARFFLRPESNFSGEPEPLRISEFKDSFLATGTIEETGSRSRSKDAFWWLNSGGRLILHNGIAMTNHDPLEASDPWRLLYEKTNPIDTDGGYYPQNIFRLVETRTWQNFSQEMYFQISRLNLSQSPNRNATNGLFLFNRYASGDNVYYTGIRVDGAAVIKKKYNGVYYTMGYKPLLQGKPYDRKTNPNVLPLSQWMGLKSEVTTDLRTNIVRIRLYTDIGRKGVWTLALEAFDNGVDYGGTAILDPGFVGVRTDFMDVIFSDYHIRER